MGNTKDIVNLIASGAGVISVPPDTYTLTSPITIPPERTLDGNGSTFIVTADAGFVLRTGSGLQRCTVQSPTPAVSQGKYGVVTHGSLGFLSDVLFNGFDIAWLLEGGARSAMLYPPLDEWTGADNVQGNRIRIWNSHRGIYAHGDECNACSFFSVYATNTDTMVDDNSKSGAYWAGCYHENHGVIGYRMRSAGQAVLARCLSDGPVASFETSAGLVIGGGLEVWGPHTAVTGNGFNTMQVGDPATLQAGMIDGQMANWVKGHGGTQTNGVYWSDGIGGDWPDGWLCHGYAAHYHPAALAIASERVKTRRAHGSRIPALLQNGMLLGGPNEAATCHVSVGPAPPEGYAVEGDWCVCNRPSLGIDHWRCTVGGEKPTWVASRLDLATR